MDIDMSALRALEREKEISFACSSRPSSRRCSSPTSAPRATSRKARVELDRKTGHVIVWAAETDDEGTVAARVRRHPDRLRPDRRHHRPAGHPPAAARRRGRADLRRVLRHARATSSAASSSRARTRATSSSTSAGSRPSCRRPSRCRGRTTCTASGCAATSCRSARVRAGRRSCCRAPTPTWCASCSPSRCPRSPTARSRSRRSPARPATAPRSRCKSNRPGRQRQGRLHRPDGRAGPGRDGRAARREDRHRRLVGGPGAGSWPRRCSRRG